MKRKQIQQILRKHHSSLGPSVTRNKCFQHPYLPHFHPPFQQIYPPLSHLSGIPTRPPSIAPSDVPSKSPSNTPIALPSEQPNSRPSSVTPPLDLYNNFRIKSNFKDFNNTYPMTLLRYLLEDENLVPDAPLFVRPCKDHKIQAERLLRSNYFSMTKGRK